MHTDGEQFYKNKKKLFLTESDGHLNATAPQQLNNQKLSLAAIPFQLNTRTHKYSCWLRYVQDTDKQ